MSQADRYINYGCTGDCAEQLSTEDIAKLREIHAWLTELMPAARVAIKMLNARSALASRWRGGKDAK